MNRTESLQESQKYVDLEIEKITSAFNEARRRLCLQRNKHALIHVLLPSEILSRIFQEVINLTVKDMEDAPEWFRRSRERVFWSAMKWLPRISHICSYWRMIALSTPSFWTAHFPPTLNGLQAFMDRSRGSPLDLYLGFDSSIPRLAERWKLLRPHMWRVRKLSIEANIASNYIPLPHEEEAIIQILRHMPSNMESISVDFDDELMLRNTSFLSKVRTPFQEKNERPEGLFPHLHHIRFCFFPFNWKCGLLRNLHTLTIIDSVETLDPWFPDSEPQDLFDAVEACPQLRFLELRIRIRSHVSCVPRNDRLRTSMICLHEAILSEDLGGPFLARFALPTVAQLKLHGVVVDACEIATVLDAISELLFRPGMPITRIEVGTRPRSNAGPSGSFELDGYFSSLAPGTSSSGEGITKGVLSIGIRCASPLNVDLDALIGAIFKINMSCLSELSCSFYDPLLPSDWIRIFEKTQSLSSFSYQSHSGPENMLVALSTVGIRSMSDQNSDVSTQTHIMPKSTVDKIRPEFLLPVLRDLEIKGEAFPESLYDFSDESEGTGLNDSEVSNRMLNHQLIRCLQERRKNGFGISVLHLPSYDSLPSEMYSLEETLDMQIRLGMHSEYSFSYSYSSSIGSISPTYY
jgi:hypothetical protein